jgi:hypothetical protein
VVCPNMLIVYERMSPERWVSRSRVGCEARGVEMEVGLEDDVHTPLLRPLL